jgi:hypothetical protein
MAIAAPMMPPAAQSAAPPPQRTQIPDPAAAEPTEIPASNAAALSQTIESDHAFWRGINGAFPRPNPDPVATFPDVQTLSSTAAGTDYVVPLDFPRISVNRLIVDVTLAVNGSVGNGTINFSAFVRPVGSTAGPESGSQPVYSQLFSSLGSRSAQDLTTTLNGPYESAISSTYPLGTELELVFRCSSSFNLSGGSCSWSNVRLYEDAPGWFFSTAGTYTVRFPTTQVQAEIQSEPDANSHLAVHIDNTQTNRWIHLLSAPFALPELKANDVLSLTLRYKRESANPAVTSWGINAVLLRDDRGASLGIGQTPDASTNVSWTPYAFPNRTINATTATNLSQRNAFLRLLFRPAAIPYISSIDDVVLWINGKPYAFGLDADQLAGLSDCDLACRVQALIHDPVNTFSGAFVLPATDMRVPSSGPPLTLDRTYVSSFTTNNAPTTMLGPGWRHSFATALTLPTQAGGEPNRVIYEAPTGNRLRFTAPTQTGVMTYTPAPGVRARLVAEDSNTDGTIDSYIVTTASQRVQRFDAQGRITSETDAQGRELTYTYFSNTGTYLEGLLQTVTDASSGQTLSFQYVNNGGTVRLITVANAVNATVSYDFMTQPVAWKL